MTPTPSAPSSLDVDIPRPSPRACDTCRRKHLKCDAVAPVCGRCAAESLTCQYTPSRRGMGRRIHRRRPSRPPSCDRSVEATNTNTCMANRQLGASLLTPPESFFGQLAPLTDLTVTPMQQQGQRQEQHQQREQQQREKQQEQQQQEQQQQQQQRYPLPPLSDLLATTPAATSTATATAAATATTATTAPWSLRDADRDRLLGLFYSKFFPVHPFLVPKPFYAAQHYPRFLDLTICFVGLHYAKPPPDDGSILREAVSAVMAENDAHTAHRVQALVLYAIVLHSCQQQKEAASCVGRAAAIAISLGMHDPAFAQANAHQSPLVEESLRRTWWELYTVDVYLAAVNRRSTYETVSARPYPLLPCAQKVYELGQCGLDHPLTLRAFEDRVFSRDLNLSFPSISYRIEAVRIVGRVLSLATTDDATPDSIQALDNALASWKHNLPACKIDMVDSSGEVDLMLFQACCFISCASIFLHFPRSDLPATIPSASDIACARGYTQLAPTSGHHTIKAIAASKELSNLASIPLPLENHSPFFICGLILGCVVQLAVGIIHLHKCGLDCLQEHRDRVVLMLGTLQRMGETWTLAQNAVHCLKIVAENLFSPRTPTDEAATSPSFASNEVDVGQVFNNTAWFDLFTADDIQGNFFNI